MYKIIRQNEFDISYVNKNAKVVIVGMSPGSTQTSNYNKTLGIKENNRLCAFSGNPMRQNIINLLNTIKVNDFLNIKDCSSLWGNDFDKVSFTSILKQPVLKTQKDKTQFISTIDYSKIMNNEDLTNLFKDFEKDCSEHYKEAELFIACGTAVRPILDILANKNIIKAPIITIAHPSQTNIQRAKVYLTRTLPSQANAALHKMIEARAEADAIIKMK